MILQALFLDDNLSQLMVLKGGTALYLHNAIGRRSIDIDFSLCQIPVGVTIDNLQDRFFKALDSFLNEKGHKLFYFTFREKPRMALVQGYEIICKFLPYKDFAILKGQKNGEKAMHQGFKDMTGLDKGVIIQCSKNEYCDICGETKIQDGVLIKIYTPEMILIEKLRALCQQMPEYPIRGKKTARARDFFDIYVLDSHYRLAERSRLDPESFNFLVRNIFGVKKVDITLLSRLKNYKSYHEEAAIHGELLFYALRR